MANKRLCGYTNRGRSMRLVETRQNDIRTPTERKPFPDEFDNVWMIMKERKGSLDLHVKKGWPRDEGRGCKMTYREQNHGTLTMTTSNALVKRLAIELGWKRRRRRTIDANQKSKVVEKALYRAAHNWSNGRTNGMFVPALCYLTH